MKINFWEGLSGTRSERAIETFLKHILMVLRKKICKKINARDLDAILRSAAKSGKSTTVNDYSLIEQLVYENCLRGIEFERDKNAEDR